MPVDRCWCANLAISEAGVVYLGAAEQIFSAPGRQSRALSIRAILFRQKAWTLPSKSGGSACDGVHQGGGARYRPGLPMGD
ncbi:MAG: hypothetical protein HPM95_07720 [Alphaproteobacteria bacterium]|nr:hypothetical protein [Alphaproteobacteria bacterium]